MDSECIFSEKGKCVVRADLTHPGETYPIYCHGYENDKSRCPEWGPTLAVENYYKAKLEAEK